MPTILDSLIKRLSNSMTPITASLKQVGKGIGHYLHPYSESIEINQLKKHWKAIILEKTMENDVFRLVLYFGFGIINIIF